MGLVFSSIDESMNKKIFAPPGRIRDYNYLKLTTDQSIVLEYHTATNKRISAVEVWPANDYATEKYLVFSHGNACDIVNMIDYLINLANNLRIRILAYDYVGYGMSNMSEPTEQECYNSLEATINYLTIDRSIPKSNLYLVGQSLGTGVVIDYVSKHPWNNPIMIISPFKSICSIASETFKYLTAIDKFKNISKIKNVTCPVKIFHGKNDDLINISHGLELYEKLPNKALEPVWLDNCNHRNIMQRITLDHYLEVLNYQDPITDQITDPIAEPIAD